MPCQRYNALGCVSDTSFQGFGMAAARRKRLTSRQFALPKERKYPIDTCPRSTNAKARATQMYRKGYLTPRQYKTIIRRANAAQRRLCR